MKKVLVIAILASVLACVGKNIGFAKELPIFNQPPSSYRSVHDTFNNAEEKIWKELKKEEERREEESVEEYNERLEQEYQAHLQEFYQDTQTIYFFEKRYQSYRDEYDLASQALVIHPFDYRNPFIEIEALNYINALNFDDFKSFGPVDIPMSEKEAEKIEDHLVQIIGIEFRYDPDSTGGPAYSERKYIPRYEATETLRYMDVYLQSVTVYDTRTEEILAQKHLFNNDSPVWQFERKVEEKEDISTTCFIQTIFP